MSTKVSSACVTGFEFVTAVLFEYDTAKIVHIRNKKVGIMNRFVQGVIVAYILVYSIGYQQGYQKTDTVQSTVTIKLKGASHYDGSYGNYTQHCEGNSEEVTFDIADVVVPPQEPNGFFVMTNLWKTCNQTQYVCPESPSVESAACDHLNQTHPTCVKGEVPYAGNGQMTGNCSDVDRCDIFAWCPTENEDSNVTHAGPKIDVANFTVLIKNSIQFPNIDKTARKRNIDDSASKDLLAECNFNSSNTTLLYCPIFSLKQIVETMAGEDLFNISITGGVIGLKIEWNCNLDWPSGWDKCNPKYSAERLDNKDVKISKGYNFRFAKYHEREGYDSRDLYKAYGILFKVQVSGTGGKFDFITLVLKLGSMIALLGVAAVISDIIVLYVLKKRHYYRENKYQNVNDPLKDYEIIADHKGPMNASTSEDYEDYNPAEQS